ncbi:MAG: large subunit ribosomal protein L29 [Maribacter sp.]|jgi:large subunit ribosomal protein L29
MPTKKTEELRAMSNEELQAELTESESYLQKLKFDHAIKGLENPLVLRNIRRDVARIHTELRGREIQNMTAEQLAERSKIRERRK